MTKQEELDAEIERAGEAAKKAAPELLRLPGVVAVGSGVERSKGQPTGRAAIVITVKKKLLPVELAQRGCDALPEDIEGFPVDVVEYKAPPDAIAQVRWAVEAAKVVKDRIEGEWLKEPNVTGIGVGYKIQRGKPTDQMAIQITVQHKLPATEVARRGLRLVPGEIDGIPTDVIEAGPFTMHVAPSGSRADRKDPLVGGLSIGHASSPFWYGTLAAVVFDSSNQAMALSNEHVLDGDIGETVHQPSPVGLDDSLEVSFQLDVCVPSNFVRLDTPSTTGGSILAGAAVAAVVAAALYDEIDPTREGQAATHPAPGAKTLEEYTKVRIAYPGYPLVGTPFTLEADWKYERRTDHGTLAHGAKGARKNPHTLRYHRLFTTRRRYGTQDVIELFGVLLAPEGQQRVRCEAYHCVALLTPNAVDRTYPVVLRSLREIGDGDDLRGEFFSFIKESDLDDKEKELIFENQERLCIYYGTFSAAGVPLGLWRHWMFVQTVNTVPPGTDPLVAAQTIGGLPASDHYTSNLDIACGPFVFEDDGSFDIELL